MDLLERIDQLIDERHLLKHPFYTKWADGTLPREALQEYARQYYAFESSFPRYLSAIHTRTDSAEVRQQLLDNLWDEEHGRENHAELWLRFAEGIGVEREDVRGAQRNEATQALVELYGELSSQAPVPAAVAALYAYERQVPQVAGSKIDGLKQHYGITEGPALSFFVVHGVLDVEHSEAEREMLGQLLEDSSEADAQPVEEATGRALDAWWDFLTAVDMPARDEVPVGAYPPDCANRAGGPPAGMRPAAVLLCALLAACSGPQPSPAAQPPPLTTLPPPVLTSPPPTLPTPLPTAAPAATPSHGPDPLPSSPPSEADALTSSLRGLLDDWLLASRAPAAVLGLRLADGQTVVVAGGQTDDAGGFAVETDHRFRIGSITKTFVAALLVQLAGDGLLGLDDVLAQHLPWAPHAERVTLRQLLSHTSGMPDFAAEPAYRQGLLLDPGRAWTAQETVELVADRELEFEPGTDWAYSNTNYTLAGLVAEEVAGEPLADLLRDRIADPAGLADTYLEGLEDAPPIETAGHYDIDGDGDLENVRIVPYTGLVTSGAAAGGLSSTASDVLAFAAGLASGQLLDAAQLEELTAPAPASSAYGLGVGLFRREGRDLWGHAGGLPGYTALLVHVPADGVSAVVLVNASGVDVQSLIGDALRLVLE